MLFFSQKESKLQLDELKLQCASERDEIIQSASRDRQSQLDEHEKFVKNSEDRHRSNVESLEKVRVLQINLVH